MKIKFQLLIATLVLTLSGFAQVQNSGNLRVHSDATIALFGDFTNNGTFANNSGTLYIAGSNAQTFNGTSAIQVSNITINKTGNALQLDNELQITGALTFVNGKILSNTTDMDTEFVHFLDGSSYSGSSNASHIDGVVRKTGNDAFDFPLGDNNLLRTVSISAPGVVTDHFTAYYTATNPDESYSRDSIDVSIDHISAHEYWILNRTGGGSEVDVTLSWASNSGGVDNLADLRVARWDGTQWQNHGNGTTTGDTVSGTITTATAVSSFSPFTLASSSTGNPLPIELLSFSAELIEKEVQLSWATVVEIDNDYFTIERSNDAINWEAIIKVYGVGNSTQVLNYAAVDKTPYLFTSYYRLKQTCLDGHYEYFNIVSVYNGSGKSSQSKLEILTIEPNPFKGNFNVAYNAASNEALRVQIVNTTGKLVFSETVSADNHTSYIFFDRLNLSKGFYLLRLSQAGKSAVKKLIKIE